MKDFFTGFADAAKVIAAVLAFAALVVGGSLFKFHVWRVSHPGAPTWTYFFSGR